MAGSLIAIAGGFGTGGDPLVPIDFCLDPSLGVLEADAPSFICHREKGETVMPFLLTHSPRPQNGSVFTLSRLMIRPCTHNLEKTGRLCCCSFSLSLICPRFRQSASNSLFIVAALQIVVCVMDEAARIEAEQEAKLKAKYGNLKPGRNRSGSFGKQVSHELSVI